MCQSIEVNHRLNKMESIRKILILISIVPSPKNESLLKKRCNYAIATLLFTLLLSVLSSSGIYFIKFVGIDLEESLFSILQVTAFSCAIYSMIVGLKKRQSIGQLLIDYQTIRIECKQKTLMH